MKSIKNWDNKTWLSSKDYINSFNNFLINNAKLESESKILDIGCGRGKILGDLYTKLKLNSKPIGIDTENHKDKDKKIFFRKSDAVKFLENDNNYYDLILIKQTIHLLKMNQIKRLIKLCKKHLSPKGKIFILTLDYKNNEIPTFKLMKKSLQKSFMRDEKILEMLKKENKSAKIKKFIYTVKILKQKYLQMISDRYISTLLSFKAIEIKKGINEIKLNFNKKIIFKDKLFCLIINK
jgi:2-polyprenyl-3-methyl-5-hydroxy-6-metoxy-1,4-benzoquinol methylase